MRNTKKETIVIRRSVYWTVILNFTLSLRRIYTGFTNKRSHYLHPNSSVPRREVPGGRVLGRCLEWSVQGSHLTRSRVVPERGGLNRFSGSSLG